LGFIPLVLGRVAVTLGADTFVRSAPVNGVVVNDHGAPEDSIRITSNFSPLVTSEKGITGVLLAGVDSFGNWLASDAPPGFRSVSVYSVAAGNMSRRSMRAHACAIGVLVLLVNSLAAKTGQTAAGAVSHDRMKAI
jgi:hypothetical protein